MPADCKLIQPDFTLVSELALSSVGPGARDPRIVPPVESPKRHWKIKR
jgi:hypothetical protein